MASRRIETAFTPPPFRSVAWRSFIWSFVVGHAAPLMVGRRRLVGTHCRGDACVAIFGGRGMPLPYSSPRQFIASIHRIGGLWLQAIQRLLKAISVRTFGLGQGLEPISDFAKAFFASLLRHARIHVRVFVGFAGDSGFQILGGIANGKTRGGIADRFEIFKMTMSMAGLAFRGGAKYRGNIVQTFHIGLGREIQIATIS